MVSIGVFGISHKTAGLALREIIAGAAESLKGEKGLFFRYPTVLLSTCNRTEIYFDAEDLAKAHSDLLAFLRCRIQLPFEHKLYSYFGIDCFFHLCKVTSGLDSAILAETEIQRQVKLAYRNSRFLSKDLHFLFQKALKISKNIRSQTLEKAPTLYTTLWQMAEWRNRRILLIGNSKINRGLISYLLHKGIEDITLCTQKEIESKGFQVVDRSELGFWQKYDLIVSATKSKGYLIQGDGASHHVIFDLSVPRSVDPKTKALLYNIDELSIQKECQTDRLESLIWDNVMRLTKIRHVLDSVGMELHL